jgi:O-antigen ligase
MNKNKSSFLVVFLVEILAIFLAVFGILPREIVLISTGIMVFYFIFARVEHSLLLFILSIPLFAAMQITESFDTMANWRILLVILFLVWFFKKHKWSQIKKQIFTNCCAPEFKIKSNLAKWVIVFLIIGALSVFFATSPVAAIKKLLFLINIFLLFPIIKDVAKDEKERIRIIKAGATAMIIVLLIGYLQLLSVFIVPLYDFWQWWAENVTSVFYGSNLSELLKVSNTWFSYYADSPPTIRMFSVFPDSHSFAMFGIIGLIFLVYILKKPQEPGKFLTWSVIVFSLLALMFSGSRGVWLSAVVPFLAVIFLFIFRKEKILKPFLVMLIIFALAFPVSSLVLSNSYEDGEDATLAFKRAKSIADMEELSVKSRMGIWKTSLWSVLSHPLLGVGIGNYAVVLNEDVSAAKKGASAHNLYLDIVSEMGLLGLVAFLMVILSIFKKIKKEIIDNKLYAICFLFFLVWILIYNLFDVVLFNDKVLLFFMVAAGLLYRNEQ